jgi:hypothetical protein
MQHPAFGVYLVEFQLAHLVPAALGRFNQPFNLAAGKVFSVAVPRQCSPLLRPCIILSLSDAPETRVNRGGDFSTIYKRYHFVESWSTGRDQSVSRGVAADAFGFGRHFQQCFACPTPRDVK